MWASYQQDASVGGWVSFGLQRMCGTTVVGGELVPRKVLLQKKENSPHRYSAVDPDLSIPLSLVTAKKGPPKDTKCAGLLGFTKEAKHYFKPASNRSALFSSWENRSQS